MLYRKKRMRFQRELRSSYHQSHLEWSSNHPLLRLTIKFLSLNVFLRVSQNNQSQWVILLKQLNNQVLASFLVDLDFYLENQTILSQLHHPLYLRIQEPSSPIIYLVVIPLMFKGIPTLISSFLLSMNTCRNSLRKR